MFVEAQDVVVVIADDEVAFRIECQMLWAVEAGFDGGAIVAGRAFLASKIDNGFQGAFGGDLANGMAFAGGEEDGSVLSVDRGPGSEEG